MAKFVYDERGDHPTIRLEAAQDEEIPVEMVAAWAAMRQSWALEYIGDNLIALDNAITSVGNASADK